MPTWCRLGMLTLELSTYVGNSHLCLYNTQSNSDWLFTARSRVLQADWLILENNEKATLNINMPYWFGCMRNELTFLLRLHPCTCPVIP